MKHFLVVAALLALAVLVILPTCQADCNAKLKKRIKSKPFPNLLKNYRNGWKLTGEISDTSDKSTFYLNEYYDSIAKEGFLRFKQAGGDDVNLYYISRTKELFVYKKRTCQVVDMQNPPEPVKALLFEWNTKRQNFTILGPSALFASGWASQGKGLYYQGPTEPIRGIKSQQWAICYPGDSEPTRFWFADDKWDMGYGTMKSLPLRITSGSQTVDVMMLQPYHDDQDSVLKIPSGKGCKRLAKDLPAPPNFSNLDLEFHVEMAFSNPTVLGSLHYLGHLEVIRNDRDDLLSVTGADWQSASKDEHAPLISMQKIYDFANGHVYSYVDSSGLVECKVEARDNVEPAIVFPDRSEVSLLDTILPTYDALSNASYLGIQEVRGMPVHTFELVTTAMPVGYANLTRAVITYSFLAENEFMDTSVNQRNLPVRVAMYAYVSNNDEPYFYFFANIHDITTEMRDLNEKLNVKKCYNENDSEYTWVQLGFPVAKSMPLMMVNRANIKRGFLAQLQRATGLSPLRTPDVLIDYTENMVYITVLILGHPAISADYEPMPKMKIMEPEWTEGVITRDNCLKACSSKDYRNCSAVSYCGSVCATTTKANINASDVLVESDDCDTYVKTERSRRRNVVLTRDAISVLEDALRKSEFKFTVMHLNTRIAVATLVAETIEYSTGGLRDMIGELNPDSRHLHQRNRFQPPEGFSENLVVTVLRTSEPYAQYVGSFEPQDCADICRDREDCFAFSTCLVSRQCVVGTEARKPAFEETDFQADCTLYTKTYESKFEELPGICYSSAATKYVRATVTAECAAACLNEKEFVCKAFDFCLTPHEGKPACRLQDRSILEVDTSTDVDRSGAESCSHYTRKHISDYRKERRVRLLGTPRTVIKKVSEAECARQCWEASFRCDRFDHCAGKRELGKGDCLLYDGDKGPYGTVMSPVCNSYNYTGNYNAPVARAPEALHSNAKAAGLSFFMIFVGIGIVVAALFAYGFYKSRRATTSQEE
ncbi:uncharacterized protein [Dermacentor albipictus]|uniref:uncharacterized protein n=1 Tax=Dermacentor albipictus TaxID=60249 RepID=UPI0031FCEBF6